MCHRATTRSRYGRAARCGLLGQRSMTLSTANRPAPISSIVSLVSSPFGLLLLTLLAIGIALAVAGLLRREHPRWLAVCSRSVTIGITSMIGLFFAALDDERTPSQPQSPPTALSRMVRVTALRLPRHRCSCVLPRRAVPPGISTTLPPAATPARRQPRGSAALSD